MKRIVVGLLIVWVILAIFSAAQTVSAGEPKLPLQYGLYVGEGVECPKLGELPVPSVSFFYYGEDLSSPRCKCKIACVHNDGNVYYIRQQCLCKGEDIITTNWTIIIKSRTLFSILNDEEKQKITNKKEIIYRYCPEWSK